MAGAVAMAVLVPDSTLRRAAPIHGVNRTIFEAMVGAPSVAVAMIKHEWIYRRPGTDLYDTGDIAVCWARYLNGERPETHPGGGKEHKLAPLPGQ